jgi:hypothetical protein
VFPSNELNNGKLPKQFITAHNIVLEGIWEKIRVLLEENEDIRKMYPFLLHSLKPTVTELYHDSYNEYVENREYNTYFYSVFKKLEGSGNDP